MRKSQHLKLLIASVLSLLALNGYTQRVSISTDPLKWATASANLGVDVTLGTHYTIGGEFSFNPLNQIYSDIKLAHIMISPEVKYWFQRPQYAHFVGLNIPYTVYDVSFRGDRSRGRMIAVGITYGYSFVLSERWSFIPTLGVGYGYKNNTLEGTSDFSPSITKLGFGFSYIID